MSIMTESCTWKGPILLTELTGLSARCDFSDVKDAPCLCICPSHSLIPDEETLLQAGVAMSELYSYEQQSLFGSRIPPHCHTWVM